MIPILYEANTTSFTNNGIGRLSDCISCVVQEKESGIYECKFKYPMTGMHYSDIQEKRIIYCIHDDTKTCQPFEIYSRSAPIKGVVTFFAHHVSYKLGNVILDPFTATSCAEAFTKLKTYEINQSDFSFWTDKEAAGDFEIKVPTATRAVLAGEEGSILDAFDGGDYEWDGYTVKLYHDRGADNNVYIRYGVNMTGMTQETDDSDVYNAVVPFWYHESTGEDDPEVLVTVTGKIVRASSATTQTLRPVVLDLSDQWVEAPTQQQLINYSETFMNQNTVWKLKENIKVNFIALWQTEDYRNVAPLQRVALYDYVWAIHDELGVRKKLQVVEVNYNVLTERYDSMELGDAKQSFAKVVTAVTETDIKKSLPSKSYVQQAIDYSTDLITGNKGGYIVFNRDADGHPTELLIMDDDDTTQAVNVWRWNLSGLGHSHAGYDGPFSDIAITQDGRINATMVTTGTLTANIIKAGILSDAAGYNYWNMVTGEFSLRSVPTVVQNAIDAAASAVEGYVLETPFEWTNSGATASFSAIVYEGKNDVTANFDAAQFVWTLRTEDGETSLGTGKTMNVAKNTLGYGATITCTFTDYLNQNARLLTRSNMALLTRSGDNLTMLTQSEGEVRVVDLTVKTASDINLYDSLMGVDAADGYIATVEDFASAMATGVFDALYVNVDGDTMTGDLRIEHGSASYVTVENTVLNGKIGQTIPSELTSFGGYRIQDSTGTSVGWIQTYKTTADMVYTQIVARRADADGNIIFNELSLRLDSSGNSSVTVSSSAAWRSAIGAVNIAGDTMSGNLRIARNVEGTFLVKNTALSSQMGTTTPSENTAFGGFRIRDSADYDMAYIRAYRTTADLVYTEWKLQRKNSSGTVIANNVQLRINSDDTVSVYVNAPAAWRSAIGALSTGGGTITGTIAYKSSNITYNTAPSAATYNTPLSFQDSGGNTMGHVEFFQYTSKAIGINLGVRQYINNAWAWRNGFGFYVDQSGNNIYLFADAAACRTALGAVNKAGDTMTGKLICSAGIDIKSGSGQTAPPYFLCLNNSFSDGGNVGYVTRSNMVSAIGMGVNYGNSGNLGTKTGTGTTASKIYESGTYTLPAGTYLAGLTLPLGVNTNTATAKLKIGSTELVSVITNAATPTQGSPTSIYNNMNRATIFKTVVLSSSVTGTFSITVEGQSSSVTWTVMGYNTTSWFAIKMA